MITVKRNVNTNDFFGLSTDTKPAKTANASTFYEMDTSKKFMFDAENEEWLEQE